MPNIVISKIKTRRGTDSQRRQVIFDQGELVSTTDTNRLFIGTGAALGGFVVGSKYHPPITNIATLPLVNAIIGDRIDVNCVTYQLTASDYSSLSSWGNVGLKVDPVSFTYNINNVLTLNPLSSSSIDPSTISSPLSIISTKLSLNYNTSNFQLLSGTQFAVLSGGITEREINTSTFGVGISGGGGGKIILDVDRTLFKFNGGVSRTLSLCALPSSLFGAGLVYNTGTATLSTKLANVDGGTISVSSGTISLLSAYGAYAKSNNELPLITVDGYGRVTYNNSSIYDVLTGKSSLSSYNSTNSLSSIFNGTPSHTLSGAIPGLALTYFTALSSNGATITLSSAGFITFQGNVTARSGGSVGRFAIPIFAY